MKQITRITCGLALLLSSACTAHVFSPPANLAPLESVRVTEEGTHKFAGFASIQEIDFGPRTTTLTLRARRGLGQNLDLGLDAHAVAFDTDRGADQEAERLLGIVRLGGKWSPLDNYVALSAGVGAGAHPGGQFIAPDLGIVLAYENPYLIPFANLSGFLSQPINAQAVDISHREQPIGTVVQSPQFTWGATWALGLKLPLTNAAGTAISPYLGLSGMMLWDEVEHMRIMGMTAGIDAAF
ncbi:MAG: hypothetical protein H0U74_22285 [Bradymonadaceae bacterium]|nr:hypothetical protein [Lujinxingiaceae bacterium]